MSLVLVDDDEYVRTITSDAYRDALFLFWGNVLDDCTDVDPPCGRGSAAVRPWSTHDSGYRSCGVALGWTPGIPFRQADDQVRLAIGLGVERAKTVAHMQGATRVVLPSSSARDGEGDSRQVGGVTVRLPNFVPACVARIVFDGLQSLLCLLAGADASAVVLSLSHIVWMRVFLDDRMQKERYEHQVRRSRILSFGSPPPSSSSSSHVRLIAATEAWRQPVGLCKRAKRMLKQASSPASTPAPAPADAGGDAKQQRRA